MAPARVRATGRLRERLAQTAVVATILATPLLVGAPPAAGADGLRIETHSVYRVDPAAGVVRVSVDVTVTNELPNRVTDSFIERYFFERVALPVLAEAANLGAVRDDGRVLSVEVDRASDSVQGAIVRLSPAVNYRESQRFRLSYDLPSQPPRSDGFTRVNAAFAAFAVFGSGDPGITSVEIVVPEQYDVELAGADLERTVRGTDQVFTATAIDDPLAWGVGVVARDDERLETRELRVRGAGVALQSWPDDLEWADFVGERIEDGLPVLERLIGRARPDDRDLTVIETVSPYLYGYAGWYTRLDNTIEIGDALDPDVIMHELAHIWFNDRLFADRWVNEAFAEEFASRTLAEMGEPLREPGPASWRDPGHVDLNEWSQPRFQDEISQAQEEYGYNASWLVLRNIVDEIGIERLGEVIEHAAERRIAYAGDAATRAYLGAASWERLLDLLEEAGGSERANTLFYEYVITPDERPQFAERAEARLRYDALRSDGDAWTPPAGVRESMSGWSFAQAEVRIARASALLERRDEMLAVLEEVDAELPASLEEAYERMQGDGAEVAALFSDYEAATGAIGAAHEARGDADGVFATIGLFGTGAEGDLEAALDDFAAGEAIGATEMAEGARDSFAGAVERGQQRAAVGAAVLLAFVGGVVVLPIALHRREERRRAAAAQPAA